MFGFMLLVGSWVIRANLQTSKAVKRFLCSDFTWGDETCTINEETSFLGLLAFVSRPSDCCGRRNLFLVKTK